MMNGFGMIDVTKNAEKKYDKPEDQMIKDIVTAVHNKDTFQTLKDYANFTERFLAYIEEHKQAEIVSQNEQDYKFFQFDKDSDYRVTRPFNSTILYSLDEFSEKISEFWEILDRIKTNKRATEVSDPSIINRTIYTMQQAIGFALDASSQANRSRKLNGDYFEFLILLLFRKIGIDSSHGVVKIPIKMDDHDLFSMNYQHDLIIKSENKGLKEADNVKIIGSVKTTSKDRIDKIFIDKYLFSKLTETQVPHIAIFLHDVQRKSKKHTEYYGVNSTFLTGHFKGYTVKLNALDGVYYFDPRPNMQTDSFLSEHIQTFDKLLCTDVWRMLEEDIVPLEENE